MKRALIPILICLILLSSFAHRDTSNFEYTIPPGMVKISSNFFADYTEVTNVSWREYTFWTARVFGEYSVEHLATLADENVWINEYPCLISFSEYYHAHPSFRSYPVVGITQNQANEFCKWRSDRVFEFFLIEAGVIEHNPNQTSNNYFSIDNYYNGKYNNTPPDLTYSVYPHYKLPSKKEWTEVRDYFLINNGRIKKCKQKYCPLHIDTIALPEMFNVVPCENDSLVAEPIGSVQCFKNKKVGYYMNGNVSEWLSTNSQYIGGNWRDTSNTEFNIPLKSKYPTDYIGFRSVFQWKKYTKND